MMRRDKTRFKLTVSYHERIKVPGMIMNYK